LDALYTNNIGAGLQPTYGVGSERTRNQLQSYLGRVNYNLLQKYLLTFTFRAVGSSRFGESNKFGFFPSAAIGLHIKDEAFLKYVSFLLNLKIRTSYGLTGNQRSEEHTSELQSREKS